MPKDAQRSPKITAIEWGGIEVEGVGRFKDCKLWPGGGREWDWRETGTAHVPGIQPSDIQDFIDREVEVVVLSKGMELRLQTCPETLETLARMSIEVFVEETKAAVDTYNRLAPTRSVGCLIHSTC